MEKDKIKIALARLISGLSDIYENVPMSEKAES